MPTEFITELFDLLQALWATPNRWLRRLIVVAVATPFLSMLAGMWYGPLAMATALVPVLVVVGWATFKVDPLIVGILNQYDFGKKFTGWVIFICGIELAWAFFCGIFPLGNDLQVSFTALFALIAAAALAGGAAYLKLEFSWPKRLAKLLVFAAFVCGIILLLVGDKPKEGRSNSKRIVDNVLEKGNDLTDIVGSFGGKVGTGSPAPPICPGSPLLVLKIGDTLVDDELSTTCRTNWIRIPVGSSFYVSTGTEGKEVHYLFSDGTKRHITSEAQPESRVFPTNEFSLWGDGVPTYTVLEKIK